MDTRSKGAIPKTARLDASRVTRRRLQIDEMADDGSMSNTTPAPSRGNSPVTLSSISIPGTQPLAGFDTPRTSLPLAQPSDHQEDVVQMNVTAEDREALEGAAATSRQPVTQSTAGSAQRDPEPIGPEVNRHLRDQMHTFTQLNRQPPSQEEYQQWLIVQRFAPDPSATNDQPTASNATEVASEATNQRPAGATNANAHCTNAMNHAASNSNGANDDMRSTMNANIHRTTAMNYGASTSNGTTSGMRRTVFSANPDLQLPSGIFRPPPTNTIQVAMESNGNHRQVIDMRLEYLRRLDEYKLRLMTETIDEVGLRMMLENTERYVDRIIKYVETREDSGILDPAELAANETLWEQAIEVGSQIKININTKLRYLEAGGPQSVGLQNKVAQARRYAAKIEPFCGEWEAWPNFKSKWTEYYHNCSDLSKMDLMVKLDEFIVPRSEPYRLIASCERSLAEAYDVAWERLCATYDNHRRQVDDIIDKFMTMPRITSGRTSYLIAQTHITNLLESLPRLEVDVTTWGPMLMHIIEQKLDDIVKAKWHAIRAPREVARLQPFMEFLTREIDSADDSSVAAAVPHQNRYESNDPQRSNDRRSQQNRHNSREQPAAQSSRSNGNSQNNVYGPRAGPSSSSNGNQRQQNSGGAANNAARANGKIVKPKRCPVCPNAEHSIYSCPAFNSLNRDGRISKASKANLCHNCLRPRCAADRCTLGTCPNGCNEKHNRLLCPKTFAPTVNAVKQVDAGQQ